jgi:putative transcriptional regulator
MKKSTGIRVPQIDIGEVRRDLGLTQAQFATRFGFTLSAVRNWEEERSEPYGVAKILLAVIACHPEVVDDVLRVPKEITHDR